MKKLSLIVILCCICAAKICAQTTQKRNVGNFNSINACCGIQVLLTQGESFSVTVEAEPNLISDVKTDVKGQNLNISIDTKKWNRNRGKITVRVTAKDLVKLEANSAAKIKGMNTINAKDIKLSVNSAAKIDLDLKANNVTCDGNSAGSINLTGEALYVKASNNSAASFNLKNFLTTKADVSSNSAASIDIAVKDEIKAHANSGANIKYYGNPSRKDISSNSGGSVKKK